MMNSLIRGGSRRGGISFGCLFLLALLAIAGYHGYVYFQPYYAKAVFSEKMFDVAESIFRQRREAAEKAIISAAAEYKIALAPEKIVIREGPHDIYVELNYEVPVVTPFIKRSLRFKIVTTRSFTR